MKKLILLTGSLSLYLLEALPQSPPSKNILESPQIQPVTLASEARRGYYAVSGVVLTPPRPLEISRLVLNLGYENQQKNTETESFRMGLYAGAVDQLDMFLRLAAEMPNRFDAQEVNSAMTDSKRFANRVLDMQRRLGATDDEMFFLFPGVTMQNVRAAAAGSGVQPWSVSQPRFVTTRQSLLIGTTEFPPGTRFEVVSQEGSDVRIRYAGGEYTIPISATDLK